MTNGDPNRDRVRTLEAMLEKVIGHLELDLSLDFKGLQGLGQSANEEKYEEETVLRLWPKGGRLLDAADVIHIVAAFIMVMMCARIRKEQQYSRFGSIDFLREIL